PAFHMEWMMNRLRAGYCLVRNPMVRNVVYRIDLSPRNVDAIVFVTKNPAPMVPHLKEIASMGYLSLFQVTITPYAKEFEPGVKSKADVVDAFKEISERYGADRIIWRYDPIVIDDVHNLSYHKRKFELLCRELEGYTNRCTFSFVEIRGKLLKHGDLLRSATFAEMDAMAEMMVPIARKYGMELSYCCSKHDLSKYGVEPRGCIDRQMMRKLDIPFEELSTPLRENCLCVKNIDIGSYDTCLHNCLYCYANKVDGEDREAKVYDPESEMLYGHLEEGDKVITMKSREAFRLDDYLGYTQYGEVPRF
ncbi:MAG: DUF1848 domain-containing protein, partial [archaeon]|nr:DUF1848 domain-containing protein [archaeon]